MNNFAEFLQLPAIAVICELNPPHFGHKRLFENARKRLFEATGVENAPIICVMSGNFVQRGEPAVFPKLPRAAAAIKMGADLVVQLPTASALSSAEDFALGAAALVHALGAEYLAFGSESGDLGAMTAAADALDAPECGGLIRSALKSGQSYPRALTYAAESLSPGAERILSAPNDMLGAEYIRALRRLCAGTLPLVLLRTAGVSSKALREELRSGGAARASLPPETREFFGGAQPIFAENLEMAMLSRLRDADEARFFAATGGGDGVAQRAVRAVRR
ncbi:MAG: nucleotidyltransferase family protein, partial [Oscillospiraceae bacterium]|nr:nucleotidyltransferase family protein [Oscillospiraceae bacterium]